MPEKPESPVNPHVYLDIRIGKIDIGRIVIELRKDICPITCENFRALCTGERGLTYVGSKFHKVIKLCLAQGGDIKKFSGTSGESIYGKVFDDENFILKHEVGSVSMANYGRPNTNNSQFFITTVECSHLDDTNVVFGRVVKGLSAVNEMEFYTTDEGIPSREIQIIGCGEIKEGESWEYCDNDETSDKLPPYPADWDDLRTVEKIERMLEIMTSIKDSGNFFYRLGNYHKSAQKYKKCTRYYNHFKDLIGKEQENLKKLDDFQLVNLTNLAATELKIESYDDVRTSCTAAIKLEPKNSKALYRRGIANFKLNNFEDAVDDLSEALKLQPGNHEISKALQQVKKILKDYRSVEKIKYQKMFQ